MKRAAPLIFFGAIVLGAIGFFYLTYLQYAAWRDGGSLTQYLVPPHQSIWYVVGYVIGHQVHPYILSLGISFVFLGAAILLNEYFGQRFFEDEEPYFGALAIFLLGNPLWMYYLAVIIVVAALITIYHLLITKENRRFSLYFLWWPAAIIVFLVSKLIPQLV